MLTGPTFHLEDDLGAVLTPGGVHLAPVGAAVLEAGAPQQQGGVAMGNLLGKDRSAASQLTPLVLVLVLVVVVFFFFGVSGVVVFVVIVTSLELVDGHALPEPLDGLLITRREAAGQQTLLQHHAGHCQVWNNM